MSPTKGGSESTDLKTRLKELTLKGVKYPLNQEEQYEWLTYYSLIIDQPGRLAEDTYEQIGIQMFEWIDFCLLNIGNIVRLRGRNIPTGFTRVED